MLYLKKYLTGVLILFVLTYSSAQVNNKFQSSIEKLNTFIIESKEKNSVNFIQDKFQTLQIKKDYLIKESKSKQPKFLLDSLRTTLQLKAEIDNFIKNYEKELTDVVKLRSIIHNTSFARKYKYASISKAEEFYNSLTSGQEKIVDSKFIKDISSLKKQYGSIINASYAILQKESITTLEKFQKNINLDIQTISNQKIDTKVIYRAQDLFNRINPSNSFNSDLGNLGVNDLPPYYPPNPSNGPRAPVVADIIARNSNSMTVAWHDRSDDEEGNRLLRSTDLFNFTSVQDYGPFEKFSRQEFTDQNLEPNTKYCYKLETFNSEGSNSSQYRCAYTTDGNNIPVWRVQLKVKVADLSNAGTDRLIRFYLDRGNSVLPITTNIDYGVNDFERGEEYFYDLNFDGITDLSDIIGFRIVNSSGDKLLLSEMSLLINQRSVFSRDFGITSSSVLNLENSYYQVEHDELQAHSSWLGFIEAYLSDPIFLIRPLINNVDNNIVLQISNEQLVSRIEGLIGHLLHEDPDLSSKTEWGKLNGPAVEIVRKDASTISVDLDLELDEIGFNPSLDVDFDIKFSSSCRQNGEIFKITFNSQNFTTNADASWWQDIISLGLSKIVSDVADWYSENCTSPPLISKSIEINLPENINCDDLSVNVDINGNLNICCITF
ncbi:fibronectin type III domain-containing protein [Psychroserpens luteus]|uniref:Fibronectin type III domain-containing protein n=1 Tax=Psychroserpens luteus TaxID=1434066 RepID=A0ABW5ZZI0_9FLAO|nr:fibronectin type III domain-containing protein [Psychroserpens luteus]